MRVHPLASLIWPLVLAAWCLVPLHEAGGATLAWSTSATGERLVFTFASTPPAATPKKVGGNRVLVPIPWSFWKREAKPRAPGDVPDSALFRGLEVYQSGLGLKIAGPFEFTASTDARNKTLTIELRDPRSRTKPALSASASVNASQADVPPASANATNASGELSAQGMEPARNATVGRDASVASENVAAPPSRIVSRRVGPGQVFRSRITWPEHGADVLDARNASVPAAHPGAGDFRQAGNATEPSGPVAAGPGGPSVSPVSVVQAPRQSAAPAEGAGGHGAPAETAPPRGKGAHEPEKAGNATIHAANGTAGNASLGDAAGVHEETRNATLAADVQAQLALAEAALADGYLAKSRGILQSLLDRPDLPGELREELLFMVADIMMQENKDNLAANFSTILQAYETAKNFDPPAERLPDALVNMGFLHLAVGNTPEAKGYFDYLRRRFPDDPRVPMVDYYWGEHYAAHGDFQKAADHFQYALQNYPDSEAAKASSVGLLKCMFELGFVDKALELVDNIEKRWPDSARQYPAFLMSAGYTTMMKGQLDRAREYFWRYYNLVPRGPDADMALVHIGDIFVKTGKHDAARDIFHKVVVDFPIKEGGLIAQMRLAEEGLLAPSGDFIGSSTNRTALDPERVYTQILKDPTSSLAPVARLKLAMLHLWNKRHAKALEEAKRFQTDYPKHELAPKAREVEGKAIREWIRASLEHGDFKTLLDAWDRYGNLLVKDGEMEPQIRAAVAKALMATGQADKGIEMTKPLIFARPKNAYSEPGLDLVLPTLVDAKRWREVVDVVREASTWNPPPEKQRLLDYTAALAHENLDQREESKKYWRKIATDLNYPEDQRVYALYFLARDAMAGGDVERAGILAQDTLNLLLKDKKDVPKIKDCLEMLIRAAEASGRDRDALSWILQYDEYISESDPNWPAFTYRKALLYKKLGDQAKWREIVQGMITKKPDDLYSRMGASELEGLRLEQETKKFQ